MVASTGPPPLETTRASISMTNPTLHVDKAIKASEAGWGSWLVQAVLSPRGQRALRFVLRALHVLLSPLIALRNFRRPHRPLPPLEEPLLERSAQELARLIRTRQVKSEEVVAAFVARVRAVNPLLNAVVEERFEAALQEARAVDAQIAEARDAQRLALDRPLLGVPFTVKESLAVAGLSHASGRLARRGQRAARDAEVVARMRAAGAIPLLVSSCPELCMFYETFNLVTGTTRNPHDTRRTPGGSSGGEAALLGAGASVIGMGSDIGGSLRLPAMFTGVFGHKPTPGVVSDVGHRPTSDDADWWKLFSVGPMSRYAEDLPSMLKIIAKDDILPLLKLDEKVDVSNLRIFFIEDDGTLSSQPVSSDIITGMHRAIDHLKTVCKVAPQKINIKDLRHASELFLVCLLRLEGVESVFHLVDNPNELKSASKEWLKFFVGMSEASIYSLTYAPMKWLFRNLPYDQVTHYLQLIAKLRMQLEEMLGDDAVLLYPTFIQPSIFHREMFFMFPSGVYCGIFNVLQFPSTNCPVGKSKEGLPIGIQIAAARHQDRLTFAVAQELEKGLGGWVKP